MDNHPNPNIPHLTRAPVPWDVTHHTPCYLDQAASDALERLRAAKATQELKLQHLREYGVASVAVHDFASLEAKLREARAGLRHWHGKLRGVYQLLSALVAGGLLPLARRLFVPVPGEVASAVSTRDQCSSGADTETLLAGVLGPRGWGLDSWCSSGADAETLLAGVLGPRGWWGLVLCLEVGMASGVRVVLGWVYGWNACFLGPSGGV